MCASLNLCMWVAQHKAALRDRLETRMVKLGGGVCDTWPNFAEMKLFKKPIGQQVGQVKNQGVFASTCVWATCCQAMFGSVACSQSTW